jgi:hypothetical protein
MEEITEKLKEIMKSRKNKKIIYKKPKKISSNSYGL